MLGFSKQNRPPAGSGRLRPETWHCQRVAAEGFESNRLGCDGCAMECLNCLSKEARVRRPLGFWDYAFSPLLLPVKCKRCLNQWRFPTVLILLEYLVEKIERR